MKKFDIALDSKIPKARVVSTTKAGFVTAALEALTALSRPTYAESDEEKRQMMSESERAFTIEGPDFNQTLVNFLNEAVRSAAVNQEAYVGLRLSLITDAKLVGDFLGKPVTGFKTKIKAVEAKSLSVAKNLLGYWEATISFERAVSRI